MFLLGTLTYIIVILSYVYVGAVTEMIDEARVLAPEITYAMFFLYFVPMCIHIGQVILKKNTTRDLAVIDKQTKLAASVSVSLGLIGTFQGLTAMVSAIAGSLGGEGDMMSKINTMMQSISSALAAMSYAFLTSILGVAISVLLLISLNFWCSYYKEKAKEKNTTNELKDIYEKLETLSEVTIALNEKIVVLSNSNEDNKSALEKMDKIVSNLDSILEFFKQSEVQNREGLAKLISTMDEGFKSIIVEQERFHNGIDNKYFEVNEKLDKNILTLKEGFSTVMENSLIVQNGLANINNEISQLHESVVNGYQKLEGEHTKIKSRLKKAIEVIYEI